MTEYQKQDLRIMKKEPERLRKYGWEIRLGSLGLLGEWNLRRAENEW